MWNLKGSNDCVWLVIQNSGQRTKSINAVVLRSPLSNRFNKLTLKYILLMYLMTYILPVVLYGCETWSLTLREEHRLRVFENRVLRRIFGPKRDEVAGRWRKLHNKELRDLYSSPNITKIIKSRRMRWAGHVAPMGKRQMRIGCWWESQRERDR
jgi:hypothetical protein